MKIEIFKPWDFKNAPLNLGELNSITGREYQYSSLGRAAFFHLLRALEVKDKILIPVYICESILEPVKRLGLTPIFYDIDPRDLNGDLTSLKNMTIKSGARAALLASLYGNPADLVAAENLAQELGLVLIDDGAQSFGAKIENRFVSTFGQGGFFSFSPGKPTAAHMGAFFWSKNNYLFKKSKNCFFHLLRFAHFKINRQGIYKFRWLGPVRYFIQKLDRALMKWADFYFDDCCDFELPILGGVLKGSLSVFPKLRQELVDKANQLVEDKKSVRALKCLRGSPRNHKIVWIFEDKSLAIQIREFLKSQGIYTSSGFQPLVESLLDFPGMAKVNGCVVEIPIEDNDERMAYLFQALRRLPLK